MYNHTLPVSVFVTLLFFLSSASLSLSHFGCLSVSGIVSHCLVLSLFVSPSSTTLTKACEGGERRERRRQRGEQREGGDGIFFPSFFSLSVL